MHGDENGGVGIAEGRGLGGGFADAEVFLEINVLEGIVGADQFPGKGGGLKIAGQGGLGIPLPPAIVMPGAGIEDMAERFGRGEVLIFPVSGKFASEGSMIRVAEQEPVVFLFDP